MREVTVRDLGASQHLITYGGKYSFRTAVEDNVRYVGASDMAECCEYKAARKLISRIDIPKIKLSARRMDRRRAGYSFPMWFVPIDDAVAFVTDRALDDDFREWFIEFAEEMRNVPSHGIEESVERPSKPALGTTEALEAKPTTGMNISPETIDNVIGALMALKNELASASTT